MLIKLEPEQINAWWEVLAPMVAEALPPQVENSVRGMTNILTAALLEDCQFWGYYKDYEKSDEKTSADMHALVVTSINIQPLVKVPYLEIFALYGNSNIRPQDIAEGMGTLRMYAEKKGCQKIIAYTANPALVRLLESHNWKSNFKVIETSV